MAAEAIEAGPRTGLRSAVKSLKGAIRHYGRVKKRLGQRHLALIAFYWTAIESRGEVAEHRSSWPVWVGAATVRWSRLIAR